MNFHTVLLINELLLMCRYYMYNGESFLEYEFNEMLNTQAHNHITYSVSVILEFQFQTFEFLFTLSDTDFLKTN